MFIYLLFVDTTGLALDLYLSGTRDMTTKASFLRARELIPDIILIVLDFLLCFALICISGYGSKNDVGKLFYNFHSSHEDRKALEEFIIRKKNILCIFRTATPQYDRESLSLRGFFENYSEVTSMVGPCQVVTRPTILILFLTPVRIGLEPTHPDCTQFVVNSPLNYNNLLVIKSLCGTRT